MLISHSDRTAVVAWAPVLSRESTALLATATVAGALDASFSTATTLDIVDPLANTNSNSNSTNVSPPTSVSQSNERIFRTLGSVAAPARFGSVAFQLDGTFNRIAWGIAPDLIKRPLGVIAGGLENGELAVWDPRIILDNAANNTSLDPYVFKPFKHKGPVRGVDFNTVDSKFLASGATDGELFVWDLTNPTKPYSPGNRSIRLDDVTAVAWNRMYHYILASASNNGNTVIWDLRNRNEIAAFSHPGGRRQISSIAWNPDSPTQIATASDDDTSPVILMWDLRNSRAPEKVLTGHNKGILNLAWCPKDSDLLLSCGKDNRTIVWNPNSGPNGTVVGDLHISSNWSFEASWCAKNPDLIAVAGFDAKVSVHSLQGISSDANATEDAAVAAATKDALAQDPHAFITGGGFGALPAQHQSSHYSDHKFTLPYPPKWLRRPIGSSWGFGSRLVSFTNVKLADGTTRKRVSIRNVVSEPAFVSRAAELERVNSTLPTAQAPFDELIAYCARMSTPDSINVIGEKDRDVWRFLGIMFEMGSREQVLQFLGFNGSKENDSGIAGTEKLAALLKKLLVSTEPEEQELAVPEDFNEDISGGNTSILGDVTTADDEFAVIAAQNKQLPIKDIPVPTPFKLYSNLPSESADTDALITKALVVGNFETAVRICFGANRLADALMFAVCGGQELLSFAQQEYFKRTRAEKPYIRVLHNVVQGDLFDIVDNAQIDGPEADWKDLLALICTYGKTEDLPALFSTLGKRLELVALGPPSSIGLKTTDWKSKDEKKFAAVLCYLVAGDLSKVLHIWAQREAEEEKLLKASKHAKSILVSRQSSHVLALQSLIEKVQVFRHAIEFVDHELEVGASEQQYSLETLYARYIEYAQVAASQGLVSAAWEILQLVPEGFQAPKVDSLAVDILRDRLYNSGLVRSAVRSSRQPKFPFEFQDIAKAPVPLVPVYNNNSYNQSAGFGFEQNHYNNPLPAVPQNVNRFPSNPGNQYINNYNSGFNNSVAPQSTFGQQSRRANAFAPPPPPPVSGASTQQQYNQSTFAPPLPPTATGQYGANPYATPSQSSSGLPPSSATTGFAPPPPVASRSVSNGMQYVSPQPGNQMAANHSHSGGVPAPSVSSSVPPQQSQEPSASNRFPSGDRSHIKPENLESIVKGLDKLMALCKESKTQPLQRREWEDTERKVGNLFDAINNSEIQEDVLVKLKILVKSAENGDHATAHKTQVELMTTRFSVTSTWIIGVKRVVDTLNQLHLDKIQATQSSQSAGLSTGFSGNNLYAGTPSPQSFPGPLPARASFPPPPPAAAVSGSYGGSSALPPPPPGTASASSATSNIYRAAATAPPPVAESGSFGAFTPPPPSSLNPYGGIRGGPQASTSVSASSPQGHQWNNSATAATGGPRPAGPPPAANNYAGGYSNGSLPAGLPPSSVANNYAGGPPPSRPANSLPPPPPKASQSPYGGRPPVSQDSGAYGGGGGQRQMDIDSGSLAVFDVQAVDMRRLSNVELDDLLRERTRASTQALFDVVFALPIVGDSKEGGAVLAQLPVPTTRLPRALPAPSVNASSTRWEQFAKLKGITKKKKTRREFDETTGRLKVRYGFDERADRSVVPSDWLVEVKNTSAAAQTSTNGNDADDAFSVAAREKSARVAKNAAQNRRNRLESPAAGLTPREARRLHLKAQITDARTATASIGRFDKKAQGEENVKFARPKRKFDDVSANPAVERAKMMKAVEKVNKNVNTEGNLIASKAVSHIAQQKKFGVHSTKKPVKGARKNKR
ncbi:protein transport protein S31 [Physocladia obscura]|uniref:Protein transport protein SEC31 n=1 Tax=Physocladia obscura TaxID=109957 RepID=A0AAD5TDY3_9FUNG|nr:protein transport protein S31 [Physocladia obscura]